MSRTSPAVSWVAVALTALGVAAHAEAADPDPPPRWSRWSVTATGQYTDTDPADDDIGGWFDQYEFTPNKDEAFPLQIGIREGAFDLFEADSTPVLQLRLDSPTSNLGISGSQASDPFLDQRLETQLRLDGLAVDFLYRRIRTEDLRLFPNTLGPGLVFQDRSDADDRFERKRTGFRGEVRLRPYQAFDLDGIPGRWLAPEVSLRGGYDSRRSERQIRTHRAPSNVWIGLSPDSDRSVGTVGAGLLAAPDGRLTLTFDFDHERLRFDAPVLTDGALGLPPPGDTQAIGFTPSTDRSTGRLRFNGRIGERTVIEGGFQVSQLDQVDDFTPDQRAAGLEDNFVRTFGANAAFDARLARRLSLNGFFKLDRRENHIERDTSLFNPWNGSQVDPFVKHWQRFLLGSELEVRLPGANRVAAGIRYEDVDRARRFSELDEQRILPENAHVRGDTQIVTLYARSAARPWRRLRLDADLGYRWAPETGYATDLDDNVYGELRASYAFQLPRALVVSAYVRGSDGENRDFTLISGQGPAPAGERLHRSYAHSSLATGATASLSPLAWLGLFTTIAYARQDRDASLDLSDLPRYWQDQIPLDFMREGLSRFRNEQLSLVLGSHFQISEGTDAGLSYAFTRAHARYRGADDSAALAATAATREIESDTHVLDLEAGHWLQPGLRVLAGYRYQHHDDRAPRVESTASSVPPSRRSTSQHTVTLGVTLTSDLYADSR